MTVDSLADVERLLDGVIGYAISEAYGAPDDRADGDKAREAVRLLLDAVNECCADGMVSIGRKGQRDALLAVLAFARSLGGEPS